MKTWKRSVLAAAVLYATAAHATEPRSESRTYNARGLLESIDGPRTDVADITRYAYDDSGRLATVTDALGGVTRYADYNAYGNPGTFVDANQVVTRLTYTPEGWLAATTRDAGGVPSTSNVEYDAVGDVVKSTDADGVVIRYVYDDARRLVEIVDGEGNRLHYTLDAAGNRIEEETFDATGSLRRKVSRTFNGLSQLMSVLDGMGRTILAFDTAHGYDALGHATESADASGIRRKLGYDGLGRLVNTLENYSGSDEATRDTQIATSYDSEDHVEGISDREGLNTLYTRNGLGDLTEQSSPDTGTTRYTHDAAGNVIRATDARGITVKYAYDALNRRTSASYADSGSNAQWLYDEANSTTGCESSFPIGRLTRVVEHAVTTTYCYDPKGNVTKKRQVQGPAADTLTYAYTAADRIARIGRPDGGTTVYGRDALGRIVNVSDIPEGGEARTVTSQVVYLPFGPVLSYVLGNGQALTRTYDANYAVTDIVSPAFELHLTRDAMGRIIESHSGGGSPSETYRYDDLSRLRWVGGLGEGVTESYTYNRTGDRLSKSGGGLATGDYSYLQGSHRLATAGAVERTYDAAGNTLSNAVGGETFSFTYNARNRLASASRNDVVVGTYVYNAAGQRVSKVVSEPVAAKTRYTYDETSFLIGESGSNARSYIWMDAIPVGLSDQTSDKASLYFLHADMLGTPRMVTSQSGGVVWEWKYRRNAFGEVAPSSSTVNMLNLRFPGQYFDAESGWNYNINRSYDPASGRYAESDPLGPYAGPSTYAYAASNPLNRIDPSGLVVNGTYNLKTGVLTLVDSTTGETVVKTFESGGKPYGQPIPSGWYDILAREGKKDFYRLEAIDANYGDDIQQASGRDAFRLHRPGLTIGCVSAKEWSDWTPVDDLLKRTEADKVIVPSLSVYPWRPKTEEIVRYGRIGVID